ncbi:MAG: MFS transporter [Gammaproteobacteria bacterium]|jgi:MFS family permease
MNTLVKKYKKLYPWIAILLSSLFLFYKYTLQVSPSVMTMDLMRYFHVNGVGLGNLAATYFYSYLIVQIFAGPLLDKYSPKLLTMSALACCALGALVFAASTSLTVAELSRLLIGVGGAFATVSYMKMVAVWFKPSQFAFVSGFAATAAMIGALFGEAPLSLLVTHVGWQHSLKYCAFFGLVIVGLFLLLARDKKLPNDAVTQESSQKITAEDVWQVLTSKANWLLAFYSGLAFAPVAVFGGLWGNPFLAEAYHLGRTHAASLVSLVFLGLAFGGPLLGFVSDKLNNRLGVMTYGSLTSLVAVSLIIYVPILPLWLLGTLLFIFGFGTGAFMLGFAAGKDINKISLAATVIAFINTGDAIFGAVTEPLIGKVLDLTWSGKIVNGVHYFTVHDYQYALLLLPVYLIVALGLLWLIKKYVRV